MSLLQRVCKTLGILGLAVAAPAIGLAQSGYVPQGSEYAPVGPLAGDQINSALSLNHTNGFLVWADNITDGSGYGISATRLDGNFGAALAPFRINLQGADDQEKPKVSLLNGGGAAFIWQGGKRSFQHIYAAFLAPNNTFVARDVMVNATTNYFQSDAAIATLTNGNVIVTWASRGQDSPDKLQGVYGQVLTSSGTKVGNEFRVNTTTNWNQRNPAVAALTNGNFVVTWVSERQRSTAVLTGVTNSTGGVVGYNSVDIYASVFNATGFALSSEILVNTSTNVCADPDVAAASDATFVVAWGEKDAAVVQNSWDVYARRCSVAGPGGSVQRVNTQRYGDQYAPRIACTGTDYLVVWTSMGQDGSREGVFGQFLRGDASLAGGEFGVNTTVLSSQKYQAVASDGSGRFLVAWSSYFNGGSSMDVEAQRYATYLQPLSPPDPPVLSALSQYALSAAWSPLAGFNVDHWVLIVDVTNSVPTTNTYWQNESIFDGSYTNDYNAGTTHTFQLAYVLTDGRTSPLSAITSGKTWGADHNSDGLPDDWETTYWGSNRANWPSSNTKLSADGTTALMVFLWGANPLDPSTWLRTSIGHNSQGFFLSWNTVPGAIYQVHHSSDLHNWTNLGGPRFAAGASDSVYLGLTTKDYFQITRLVY